MASFLSRIGLGKSLDVLHFAKQADGLRLKGHTKKAIQLCQEGLKQRPAYSAGYFILARCYADEGHNDRARDTLSEALRHEPHNIAVLTELAALYDMDDARTEALNYYGQALAIDPLNNRIRNLVQRLTPKETTGADVTPETGQEPSSAPSESYTARSVSIPTREETIAATAAPPVSAEPAPSPELVIAPVVEADPVSTAPAPVYARGVWIADLFQTELPSADPAVFGPPADGSAARFTVDTFESMLGVEPSEARSQEGLPAETMNEPVVLFEPSIEMVDETTVDTVFTDAVEEDAGSEVAQEATEAFGDPEETPASFAVEESLTSEDEEEPAVEWPMASSEEPDEVAVAPLGEEVTEPADTGEPVWPAEPVEPAYVEEASAIEEAAVEPVVDEAVMFETPEAVEPAYVEEAAVPSEPEDYLDQFFRGLPDAPAISLEPAWTAPLAPEIQESVGVHVAVAEATEEIDLSDSMSRLVNGLRGAFRSDRTMPESAPPPVESIDETPGEGVPNGEAADAIPTATLAELYVDQGLLDRAISVYLSMIEHDPGNPEIHKRLSELFVKKAEQIKL